MENAQARTLVVLAVVLLAVTALLTLAPEGDAPDDPDATVRVWQIASADAIEGVRLERADGSVVLTRTGEGHAGWRLTEPLDAPADPDAMLQLLDALRELDFGIGMGAVEDVEDFGLGDPPRVHVEVMRAEAPPLTLDVGVAAPVGFQTYARLPTGEVVAVSGRPGDLLSAPAERFRDHRVFAFDPAQVRDVRIEGPDGVLHVFGAGTRWWLEGFTRADPDRVDDLVMALLDLRLDRFVDDDDAVPADGFTVVVTEEDGTAHRATVGDPESGPVVVRTGATAGEVAAPRVAFLGQGPTDIGDTRALPIDPRSSDQVEIVGAGAPWVARRDGARWLLDGDGGLDVTDAITALAAAPIRYQRMSVPEPAAPRVQVTVREGGQTHVVWVGGAENAQYMAAHDAGGGAPYLIPAESLAILGSLPRP